MAGIYAPSNDFRGEDVTVQSDKYDAYAAVLRRFVDGQPATSGTGFAGCSTYVRTRGGKCAAIARRVRSLSALSCGVSAVSIAGFMVLPLHPTTSEAKMSRRPCAWYYVQTEIKPYRADNNFCRLRVSGPMDRPTGPDCSWLWQFRVFVLPGRYCTPGSYGCFYSRPVQLLPKRKRLLEGGRANV
jgi:hypothetical protein